MVDLLGNASTFMSGYELESPEISVLIPVYNTEAYLGQCLESIVNQTFRNFEIIILDDGSTDGSSAIIGSYAARDNRIRVVQKHNTGYGDTLNQGLLMARGKYTAIVESDDYAALIMLETLYGIAEENGVEIVKSAFYRYRANSKWRYSIAVPKRFQNKKLVPINNHDVFTKQNTVCSALYKTSFLIRRDIRFLPTPGASFQDISFLFKAYALAGHVFFADTPLFYYRSNNPGSSSSSKEKVFCVIGELDEIENFIQNLSLDSLYGVYCRLYLANYFWTISRVSHSNRKLFLEKSHVDFRDLKTLIAQKNIHINAKSKRKMWLLSISRPFFLWKYRVRDAFKELRYFFLKKLHG